jgi:hypothetical protein
VGLDHPPLLWRRVSNCHRGARQRVVTEGSRPKTAGDRKARAPRERASLTPTALDNGQRSPRKLLRRGCSAAGPDRDGQKRLQGYDYQRDAVACDPCHCRAWPLAGCQHCLGMVCGGHLRILRLHGRNAGRLGHPVGRHRPPRRELVLRPPARRPPPLALPEAGSSAPASYLSRGRGRRRTVTCPTQKLCQ